MSLEEFRIVKPELNKIFNTVRLTRNQKEWLTYHFKNLKKVYRFKGKNTFNKEYATIKGLGKVTKNALLSSFEKDV